MRRYDEDTATLLPEDYATSAEACEAWASALAAEGHDLAEPALMLTCAGASWCRWTMRRSGLDDGTWLPYGCRDTTAPEGFDD